MRLSEIIIEVGDENIGLQNLDECTLSFQHRNTVGTDITFRTSEPIGPDFGTERMGLVLWLPREKVKEALARLEGGDR